eukprot:7123021-Pyramimonas_sp.AAC.1
MLLQKFHPPTRKLGLQHHCGGDRDECLALAGASLRPRSPALFRAQRLASLLGATDGAAVALTAGHFPAGTSVRVGDLGWR